jgi:hypothetical protein
VYQEISFIVNFGRKEYSAVLAVLNVKVRMEARHFVYPPSLQDLQPESFSCLQLTSQKEKKTIFVFPISQEEIFYSAHDY